MKLTAYQLKALQATFQARDSGPTVTDQFVRGWKTYFALIIVGGALSAFYWWGGWPVASVFIVGFCTGALWRDITWARLRVRLWPLSKEITNWERVSDLLAENERLRPDSPSRHTAG
jgi:hypothetical protein